MTIDQVSSAVLDNGIGVIGDFGHGDSLTVLNERIEGDWSSYSVLIHVGDAGIGMGSREDLIYQLLDLFEINETLIKQNQILLVVRGNHDNPAVWRSPDVFAEFHNFSRICFVPDFTRLNLAGENFLFFGGAISIDRSLRQPGLNYYTDEGVDRPTREFEDILAAGDFSVVVSHNAPVLLRHPDFFNPRVYQIESVKESLHQEEQILEEMLLKIPADRQRVWVYGHFHKTKKYHSTERKFTSVCVGCMECLPILTQPLDKK